MKRYQAISRALGAMRRCENMTNPQPIHKEWADMHSEAIKELCSDLPSGSGFDSGSHLDFDASTAEKLVFTTSFHHMDDGGGYDGWTEHTVILTPSLEMGYSLKVTGRDRNDIKSYIGEMFSNVLDEDIDQWTGYPKPETATVAT